MRKLLAGVARPFLAIPPIRRWYLRRVLHHIEETPASKLSAELRQVKTLLERLPKAQRLGALEAGLRGERQLEAAGPQSRALRRAAERQARRRG